MSEQNLTTARPILFRVAVAAVVGIVLAVAIGVGAIRMLTNVDPWPVLSAVNVPLLALAVASYKSVYISCDIV